MSEPPLRLRETSEEEVEAARVRPQGDSDGEPDRVRGPVPERILLRLSVRHLQLHGEDVLNEPVHAEVAPGTAAGRPECGLPGEYLSQS